MRLLLDNNFFVRFARSTATTFPCRLVGGAIPRCRTTAKRHGFMKEQNRYLTYNGTTQTIAEWAKQLDIPYQRLWSRICVHHMPTSVALFSSRYEPRRVPKNSENNHYLTFNGITQTIAQWAKATGMPYNRLHARITVAGWSPERALSTPKTWPQKPPSEAQINKKEYLAWSNAKQRCHNPKHPNFFRYGQRGIAMCPLWRGSFKTFLKDMGPCPPGHTIERKNNDGNYEPGNCVWAIRKDQSNNTRRNKFVVFNGVKMTIAEAARKSGIRYETLFYRVKTGWLNPFSKIDLERFTPQPRHIP